MYVKTPQEIEIMAEGGHKLARILRALKAEVKAGVKTKDLDRLALEFIRSADAKPAFLGYRPNGAKKPYPATICASVNSGVVHGLPSNYELQEGDLLKIDIGLIYKGYYADTAVTVPIGKVSERAKKLIQITETALKLAIKELKPGHTLGDVGARIQIFVERNGFSVVRALTGHGIGKELHEDPHVFNYGKPKTGLKLVPGMVFAIEPMVNMGGSAVRQEKDDSFVTADGSLAAHFEHTVAVTETGSRVLTE